DRRAGRARGRPRARTRGPSLRGGLVMATLSLPVPVARAHAVILNPSANGGRGRTRFAAAACDPQLARQLGGLPVFDGLDTAGGDERQAARGEWLMWQVRHGRRHFVAAGGDGTVNLALNGLLAVRRRLGLPRDALRLGALGIGSSNDFLKPVDVAGRGRAG